MQSTNKLGLMVAGVSGIIVVLVFGAFLGIRALLRPDTVSTDPAEEDISITSTPTTIAQIEDRDGDGLADNFEPIYRTDPSNPDTDGDGTSDGDELALLRDPIRPGPDDTLEALTEEGKPDTSTYTGRYLALLPTEASRADILSREQIEAFIESEQGELLPTIDLTTIPTTDTSGEEAVSEYLNTISASHNPELVAVTSEEISQAFQTLYAGQTPQTLTTIVSNLQNNLAILQEVSSPTETLELHQTLLAASQALLENVQLIENMKSDFVGGLVGAKNIEELGPVFQDIAEQISALETKYNLE